jgi:hypothetical protein
MNGTARRARSGNLARRARGKVGDVHAGGRKSATCHTRRAARPLLLLVLCALCAGAGPQRSGNAAPQSKAPALAASQPATRPSRRRVVAPPPATQRSANLVPGLIAQQQARHKIHEIYAPDYADTSFAGRRALARRLIDASQQTRRDLDAKYVLFREARDLATAAGDVTTAFDAVDLLADSFLLSKLHERVEVLKQSVPSLGSVSANLAAVSICMDLVEQCAVEGEYDRADALLALAGDASKRAKSVPYFTWVQRRGASIRPAKDAYDAARPFESALKHNPDDPEANLAMGRFVAFVGDDFDAGLTMIAKGSDPVLARLADEDLETPERASAQFKMAGRWWDASESSGAADRAAMRRRAEFWYVRAEPGLDGLDKALAQRRLQDLCPPAKAGARVSRPADALMLMPRRWYRDSIADVTWETARRLCEEAGGRLVCIESRREGELMKKMSNGRTLWLGATVDGSGRWTWLSGAEFFYSNWATGEPSNLSPDAHPVTGPGGAWRTSTTRAGFICEWSE